MGTLFSVDGSTGNLTTAGSITSTSISSGFLLPKLTTSQRNGIASPATGLEIFNTTTNQIEFYNGTIWTAVGGGGSGTVNSGTVGRLAIYPSTGNTVSDNVTLGTNAVVVVDSQSNLAHTFHIPDIGVVATDANFILSQGGSQTINSLVTITSALSMNSNRINNVADPTLAQDAATKNYVDMHSSGITGSGSTSFIPKFTSSSVIGNSLLADNGAGTLGGLTYQQSASNQSTYYMTFADNTTALSSHEMFHGQVNTFASAQNIGTMNSFTGNLIVVAGYKTGGTEQCFTDLLIMSAVSSSSAAVVTVVSSNSVNGPTARTYTVSQRSLFMQMSGNANTFNVGVRVVCVE